MNCFRSILGRAESGIGGGGGGRGGNFSIRSMVRLHVQSRTVCWTARSSFLSLASRSKLCGEFLLPAILCFDTWDLWCRWKLLFCDLHNDVWESLLNKRKEALRVNPKKGFLLNMKKRREEISFNISGKEGFFVFQVLCGCCWVLGACNFIHSDTWAFSMLNESMEICGFVHIFIPEMSAFVEGWEISGEKMYFLWDSNGAYKSCSFNKWIPGNK